MFYLKIFRYFCSSETVVSEMTASDVKKDIDYEILR